MTSVIYVEQFNWRSCSSCIATVKSANTICSNARTLGSIREIFTYFIWITVAEFVVEELGVNKEFADGTGGVSKFVVGSILATLREP